MDHLLPDDEVRWWPGAPVRSFDDWLRFLRAARCSGQRYTPEQIKRMEERLRALGVNPDHRDSDIVVFAITVRQNRGLLNREIPLADDGVLQKHLGKFTTIRKLLAHLRFSEEKQPCWRDATGELFGKFE